MITFPDGGTPRKTQNAKLTESMRDREIANGKDYERDGKCMEEGKRCENSGGGGRGGVAAPA
jgi:hypothetical protein